jgi:hypothetical protein
MRPVVSEVEHVMPEDKHEDELTISVPRAAISVPARRHRVKQSWLVVTFDDRLISPNEKED